MVQANTISILELPARKQLAFGLMIIDRMVPSLMAFSRETGFDTSSFFVAREAAWRVLEGGDKNLLSQSIGDACLQSAPDTEDFSHPLTSNALNAVVAASDVVDFILQGSPDRIANIATLATDSIYLYLSTLEDGVESLPTNGERFRSHSLMEQELRQEGEDLKFLAALPDHFDASVISVRSLVADKQDRQT